MEIFLAHNTIIIFLTASAFTLAGASFIRDSLLANSTELSKKLVASDKEFQKQELACINHPTISNSGDNPNESVNEEDIANIKTELYNARRDYTQKNKKSLKEEFEKHQANTFSFGLFGFGYLFMISLYTQELLEKHYNFYLYITTYLLFTTLLLVKYTINKSKDKTLVDYLVDFVMKNKYSNCKNKKKVIENNKSHCRNIVKYSLHFFIVFGIFILSIYAHKISPALQEGLVQFFVKEDAMWIIQPYLFLIATVLFYIILTLIYPIIKLDHSSSKQMQIYNHNRNIIWDNYKNIKKLKNEKQHAESEMEKILETLITFHANRIS